MAKACQGCKWSSWKTVGGSHIVQDVICKKGHKDMDFEGHYLDTVFNLKPAEVIARTNACKDYEAPEYF